ncbi:MAG: hypothetical protein NTW29_20590 [Bacteroidetes bacterium]|nr:hypothetical protein [Bacteroidota bacterium]
MLEGLGAKDRQSLLLAYTTFGGEGRLTTPESYMMTGHILLSVGEKLASRSADTFKQLM